jgi:hypothetical protein
MTEHPATKTKMVVAYLYWRDGWVLEPCPTPYDPNDIGEDGPHGLVKESDLYWTPQRGCGKVRSNAKHRLNADLLISLLE